MRRTWISMVIVVLVLAVGTVVDAAPKPKLPKITGGGVTQNFNSVTPYGTVELLTLGGFNAQATGEGYIVNFEPFNVDATVYDAKGQIQLRFVQEDNPNETVGSVHGSVVCIANLGPSSAVDGDDLNDDVMVDPDGNVWEIRFEITKIQGETLPPFPIYGSIFIQDGGSADFADESFASSTIAEPFCANNPFFGLEPHLVGNITVH